MIEPKSTDVGRKVVFELDDVRSDAEITGFNEYAVFVRCGSDKPAFSARREDLSWPINDKDAVALARLDELRGAGATVSGPDPRGAYLVNERWYAYPGSWAGASRHLDNSPAFSSWRQLLDAVKAAPPPDVSHETQAIST